MSNTMQEMSQLKEITAALEERIVKADQKNRMQKEIFVQYIRIFQKLAQKLALLSNRINQQILNSQDTNDEAIGNIFQHLSNALLRMADCSRNVAVKAKNEVHDPMKLFCDNYNQLNTDLLKKLKSRELELTQKYQQLNRNKQNYYQASEKLDKHKKGQSKAMTKIQNGDINQLQKYSFFQGRFNLTIKKITQNIKNSQEQYEGSVNLVNVTLQQTRRQLNEMVSSLTYNEQSRMSFSKKSLISSIKILQDFTTFFDSGVQKKIDDSLKLIETQKSDILLKKKLHTRIALLSNSQTKQQFVSYDDLIKMKRKKSLDEEYSYLNEIFNKVRQDDKEIINMLINPWFKNQSPQKPTQSPKKNKIRAKDIDECKQKILSVKPYSYYFIEEVYRRILEMSSFYLKLGDQNFLMLLNMFSTITNNLQLIQNTSNSALGIQFLYKMIQVSIRIIWKKNYASNKGYPLELLCQHYGKTCKNLSNQIILKKMFMFVQKKKSQKKTGQMQQSKGMMNTLFKGFGAVMSSRKKQAILTDDQNFTCLTEMTQILANLLIPSEVSIPFLKSLLGKNENSKSFEYLKSILLEKKDQQERQKIFFRTEIKGKKQEEIRKAIERKKMAEYGIRIAAQRGFFGKEDLGLRLINTELKNIHLEILSHLEMPSLIKWIHLIPLDKQLDYVDMKREVAENSVPSAIEEIITLDVNRSLHNHGEYLNPTILHSLLRTYAYFHKDISYCQGMNYIAGYLYIKTRNEQEAYRIFQYLMEVRFKQLFAKQFEILKIKMYQFERLLGIFHPQISDHFKKQVITPQCYIVSWMITLFASSYQYTMQSYLIDLLWERFIVFGWREFFRFVLSLFSLYKEELIELTYDRALHFLGEMGRNEMFLSGRKEYLSKYPQNKVEQGMDQYPISQELLLTLEKEYKLN